jgi:fatty-acyl-CoA synthase/long-chain acyl-CoA synthetase
VGTGDRVAVLALNGLEVWETYLAAVRLGAVVVPVNFRLVADEVAHVLADSGTVALVVDRALVEVADAAREQASGVRTVLTIGGDYEEALAAAGGEPLDVEVDEGAAAFIMYTSGTTGRPKGPC